MKTKDGGPAFPRPASEDRSSGSQHRGDYMIDPQDGMSLRDWFAGQALVGVCTNPSGATKYQDIAVVTYEIADAMIAEREKVR